MSRPTQPPCPLTGAAPRRHIQTIPRKLLTALWRHSFGVDVSALVATSLDMFESPTGLIYFHPAIAGDDRFYQALYRQADLRAWLAAGAASRLDHRAASRHIRPGWQVLDVGCGPGTFKNAIPQARYTGLDPFADAEAAAAGTLREGLREHAARRPAFYDAVCAFHVIEHTADPRAFAASLLGALKPGGLLIVSSPAWPSVMTRLPNFVFNAPPHHLTWWNARAYAALCGEFGLAPVEVSLIRGAQSNEKLQWMERLSPVKTAGVYFRHAYRWHLSLLWASLASHAASRLNIRPGAAHDEDIICVARKPGP